MCLLGTVTVELSTDQSTVIDYLAGFYPITATGAASAPGAAGGAGHLFWETMRCLNAAGAGMPGEIAELHGGLADLRAGVGELARALVRAGEEKTTGSGRASRLPQGARSMCLCILTSSDSISEPGGYTLGVFVHGRAIVVPIAWAERPPMSQEDR
jgi:hypothetical protein